MVSYYDIVEDSHIGAGLIINCLYFYAIIRFTKQSLGSYKILLLLFASYDFFLVLLHYFLKPVRLSRTWTRFLNSKWLFQRVMVVGTLIGVAADYWDSRLITSLYSTCNTVPFVLMIIDFLYRYWSISRPHLIPLFSNKKFIALLLMGVAAEYVLWFSVLMKLMTGQGPEIGKTMLREESFKRIGHEIVEGWLIMNYWENDVMNVRVFCAMMIFTIIMIGSLCTAITLGSLTYYNIYVLVGHHAVSARSLSLQRTLFVSLCAQTAVPLFTVYIPYIVVVDFPFFNLPVFFMDDACMLLTSCFPAWDAVIAIALMQDYREGLLGMTWKKNKKVKQVEAVSNFTTATPIPSVS